MTAAAGSMTAQVVSVVAQRVDDDSVRVGMKTLYVNEEVTTHIIMPEPIRLVDISTQKIAGNQCADNIVRIKPVNRMFEHELAGTVTVIGERNMVQYDIVYTRQPNLAYSVYKVSNAELDRYSNPSVTMTEGEMARFAYAIYNSPRHFYGIRQSKYGMTIRVNNIYTLNDYFFIDYSIENRSKIKYDIDEVRVKLTDKKQSKATNSQTVELSPVWSLNGAQETVEGDELADGGAVAGMVAQRGEVVPEGLPQRDRHRQADVPQREGALPRDQRETDIREGHHGEHRLLGHPERGQLRRVTNP